MQADISLFSNFPVLPLTNLTEFCVLFPSNSSFLILVSVTCNSELSTLQPQPGLFSSAPELRNITVVVT